MAIEMRVFGLTMDPFTNAPIVILKDLDEKHALPIWIGVLEASAIAAELEKLQFPRPMTHDLMKNILKEINATVRKVEVVDLKDNVYYAHIHLSLGDRDYVIDARPSDAIALALRTNSSIYVAEHVLEKSRKIDLKKKISQKGDREEADKWTEFLENLSPEDFGKYKM